MSKQKKGKLFELFNWPKEQIKEMLNNPRGNKHNFTFYGIRIWWGVYIGFVDGRLKKNWRDYNN